MSSRYDAPAESPGFLLWHTALRWQRLMTSVLAKHGLTHVQFVLLASLWWLTDHGGPPSQRQLADHAGTNIMMTSQVLREIEIRGHIIRESDPSDARTKRLRLTEQGLQVVLAALPDVEDADQDFLLVVSNLVCFTESLKELTNQRECE